MKILVIGDSCEDVFNYGVCERLAPAAPVPVFVSKTKKYNKGMAGNVFKNLTSLGLECDIVTNTKEIVKTRFIDEMTNHMIMRLDSGEENLERIDNLHLIPFESYDAVVISDYNKGFLTEEDIEYISRKHSLVFLDTKKLLGDWAREINFIKINKPEFERTEHLISQKVWIKEKLIVTLGSAGCSYCGESFPVDKVEIKDLTGAGDTFLSALVREYLNSKDIRRSIEFANACATIVVQQKGVNIINEIFANSLD